MSFQDLSERRDESCQTDSQLQPVGLDDKQKKQIEKAVRDAAKLEFNKILEEERKQHQIEVKKLKKKQWCAMCLKEGRDLNIIVLPGLKLFEYFSSILLLHNIFLLFCRVSAKSLVSRWT